MRRALARAGQVLRPLRGVLEQAFRGDLFSHGPYLPHLVESLFDLLDELDPPIKHEAQTARRDLTAKPGPRQLLLSTMNFLNSVTNMFLADSGLGMLASSNTEADQRSN
jgi:hypothetical protein